MYNTAKPADAKDTGIVRGTKKSAMVITDFLYAARARLNLTADSGLPSVIIGNEVYRRGIVDAKKEASG